MVKRLIVGLVIAGLALAGCTPRGGREGETIPPTPTVFLPASPGAGAAVSATPAPPLVVATLIPEEGTAAPTDVPLTPTPAAPTLAPATAPPPPTTRRAPTASPPPTPAPEPAFEALPTPPILVKSQDGPETWQVVDGRKRYIVDWDTFLAMGYQEKDIVVDWQVATYPDGPPLTRLVRGSDERVYWLEGGRRRHMPDMATFRALGHREADISVVPDALLITWPPGEPLPSVQGTAAEAVPPATQERAVSAYGPPGGGPHLVELYTVYADGHWPRRLSYSAGYANANNSGGAWSPDGERIAFNGCTDRASGSCAVAVTGRQVWEPVTLGAPMTWDPAWAPRPSEGGAGRDRLVLWSSHTNTIYLLDAIGVDGGVEVRELATGRSPAWTTDGHIAFWAGGAAPYLLVTLDPDGPPGQFQTVESGVMVYDQRFYPWREVEWRAGADPWQPTGR